MLFTFTQYCNIIQKDITFQSCGILQKVWHSRLSPNTCFSPWKIRVEYKSSDVCARTVIQINVPHGNTDMTKSETVH